MRKKIIKKLSPLSVILTLCPSSCCILEASIITIPPFQHLCPHKSDQDLQLSYYIYSHYLFAKTNDGLFPVIDCYEVQFIWWTSVKHRNLISIPCCFCIVLLFHEYHYNFFPECRVLFTSGFEGLIMWWWLEQSCLCWTLYKLHVLDEIFDFIHYETCF